MFTASVNVYGIHVQCVIIVNQYIVEYYRLDKKKQLKQHVSKETGGAYQNVSSCCFSK